MSDSTRADSARLSAQFENSPPPLAMAGQALAVRRHLLRLLDLLPLGHPSRPPFLAALAEARAIVAEEGHA